MSESDYGFGAARKSTSEKLKNIRPSDDTLGAGPSDLDRADAAGAALGFVPREIPRAPILRRRKEIGPTIAINMRVPEAVAAKFINFCEQNRMSYWEGVEELMKRTNIR